MRGDGTTKYDRPGWIARNLANPAVAVLVRLGLSPAGAHLLAVRGRKSGQWRTTPVIPRSHEGGRYLIARRGETQWVRNLRAAGSAELRLGSKREVIRAVELDDEEKPDVIRPYLKRRKRETAASFGADDTVSDEDLRRIAANLPVFRIVENTP